MYVVVDSMDTAAGVIDKLKKAREGRATFIPLDTIRPPQPAKAGSRSSVLEVIDFKEEAQARRGVRLRRDPARGHSAGSQEARHRQQQDGDPGRRDIRALRSRERRPVAERAYLRATRPGRSRRSSSDAKSSKEGMLAELGSIREDESRMRSEKAQLEIRLKTIEMRREMEKEKERSAKPGPGRRSASSRRRSRPSPRTCRARSAEKAEAPLAHQREGEDDRRSRQASRTPRRNPGSSTRNPTRRRADLERRGLLAEGQDRGQEERARAAEGRDEVPRRKASQKLGREREGARREDGADPQADRERGGGAEEAGREHQAHEQGGREALREDESARGGLPGARARSAGPDTHRASTRIERDLGQAG